MVSYDSILHVCELSAASVLSVKLPAIIWPSSTSYLGELWTGQEVEKPLHLQSTHAQCESPHIQSGNCVPGGYSQVIKSQGIKKNCVQSVKIHILIVSSGVE